MDADLDRKPARFPDALVLIFALICAALIATWVLPAGEFERVADGARTRVVPGTYHAVEAAPLPWHAFLSKIPLGFERAAEVIFFVFIVGGVIGILRATGAIDALLSMSIRRLGHRPVLLVAGITTLLSVGAATIGMAEEYVPFVPILVAMCSALGFDALVAVGMVYVAAGIGYAAAPHNPFTVLIAQRIAELPLNSGAAWRWGLWLVAIAVGVLHLSRYALRVRREPSRSLLADRRAPTQASMEVRALTWRHAAILCAFAAAIAAGFVAGCAVKGWGLHELGAFLIGTALFAAALGALAPNRTARAFCSGAAEMTTTALLIGFAKTIQVVLEDGRSIDGIVDAIASPLAQLGPDVAAIGMLAVQSATNLFIPSGSAQAYVTMPIMVPLADLTGVSRQAAVLAFQCGDGLTNMVIPTNAVLMGVLALGRVPYQRWLRFILPLVLQLFALFAAALVLARFVEIGP